MQKGFVHDSRFCTGCKACQVACKDKQDNVIGENFRRVKTIEGGTYKKYGDSYENNVFSYSLSISCNHCADPKCVKNCPAGAMKKDPATGIVAVDQELCIGCGYCAWSCPYGAPQLNKKKGVMGKCDMCRDLLAKGEDPVCVAACPVRALHCGDMEDLRREYPGSDTCAIMPKQSITQPSLIIIPHKDA